MTLRILQRTVRCRPFGYTVVVVALVGLCAPCAFAADDDVGAPLELSAPAKAPRKAPKARVAKHAASKIPQAPIVTRTVRTVRIDPAATSVLPQTETPDRKNAVAAESAAPKPLVTVMTTPAVPPVDPDVKAFCANVGRAASDARVAWQAAKLAELETALKRRIDELDRRIAEHRDWLAKRDEAVRRADDAVVAIYARMRPDSAALQIASLDDAMAAAVLMKLSPRNAGAILSEIPAERAARLTDAMAGARARQADEKKPS